jgi:hypothetical protein
MKVLVIFSRQVSGTSDCAPGAVNCFYENEGHDAHTLTRRLLSYVWCRSRGALCAAFR